MTPGDYARGGEGLTIDYGFHPCPFGMALVMTTDKGVCGLGFADEGDEGTALDDMSARWPKAQLSRSGGTHRGAHATYLRCRHALRSADRIASARHALADQSVGSLARDSRRQAHDLQDDRESVGKRQSLARSGHRRRTQSDFLSHPVPPRAWHATAPCTAITGACHANARCWPWRQHATLPEAFRFEHADKFGLPGWI